MIVRSIATKKFAIHDKVNVDLPERGLVFVTGENGTGKSSLAEAVSQGVWDQPIRSGPGWRKDATTGVSIVFDGGQVDRTVGKKHKLNWRVGESGAASYPTRTKSQAALESEVGSHRVWRYSCVFHTKYAAMFTEATDSERKRLLEDVLELDRIEQGYRKVRKELVAAERQYTEDAHAVKNAETVLDGLMGQASLLHDQYEDVPDLTAMREEAKLLKEAVNDATRAAQDAGADRASRERASAVAESQLREARARLKQFEELGVECMACGQKVDGDHKKYEVTKAEEAVEAAVKESAILERELGDAEHVEKLAIRKLDEAREALAENVRRGKAAVEAKKRNEARDHAKAGLADRVEAAEQALAAFEETAAASAAHAAELKATADVLSYQGVRAALLDSAVVALEELANAWLSRLGIDELKVHLSSQTATKSGKVSDKLSFELEGAGGGYGYGNASTGQQRRVDIAMTFAIAQLASTSRGISQHSTMFVDELFDGLDRSGLAAAIELLHDLAQERCVVVITHNRELLDRVQPDLHLVARNGTISGKV